MEFKNTLRYITNQHYAFVFLFTLIFNLAINESAHADNANYPNCTGSITPITINIPATLNIATIPANAPLITPITNWFSLNTLSFTGCQALPGYNINYAPYNSPIAQYSENGISYPIFPYANGIGYVMSVQNATNPAANPVPISSQLANLPITSNGNFSTLYPIRLIRYGVIASGTTNIAKIPIIRTMDWIYSSVSGAGTAHYQFVSLSATAITAQTVSSSVNTTNVFVQLPTVTPTQLTGIGSIIATTPFIIGINCPSAVNVYMTMTDNSNPASTSNIISADSSSTAQGLGVQIRQNGIPVSMGPDSSIAGNTNQFLIGNAITGSRSIPFTANYIQTGTVKVGILKALATFTMSYQ